MGSVSNPWNVPSIQDFLFFCCPECDSKVKNSQDFINHALLLHEDAKDSVSIRNEIRNIEIKINDNKRENDQIKEPVKISILKRKLEEDPEFTFDTKVQKLESTKDQDLEENELFDDEDWLDEPEGIFICDSCEKIFESKMEMDNHLQHMHNTSTSVDKTEIPYEEKTISVSSKMRTRNFCYICKLQFEGNKEYKRHIEEMHQGCTPNSAKEQKCATGNEFHCDKCDKKFDTKNHLYYHNSQIHGNKETCEVCGKVMSRRDMYAHRKKAHHLYNIPENKKVKKCDSCDTEFKSGEEMDNHLRGSHGCNKKFECKDCDKKWVSHLSLELHYVVSHKKIMFCCDTCGFAFVELTQLNRHKKRVHDQNPGHVCHICGKAFYIPWMLNHHLAVEHDIGEKRYKCDICSKAFKNNQALQRHVEGVCLKNVKYNCDQCSHSTFTKSALQKHKRRIHQGKKD